MLIMLLGSTSMYAQEREGKKRAKKKEAVATIFEKRDKNDNGRLEMDELSEADAKNFLELDKDGNGYLSQEEFSNAARFQRPKKRKGGKGQRRSAADIISTMDQNDDGKLSKDEVKGRLAEHFSKVDTDDDGFITKEELEKAPKPNGRRGQRGGRRN